MKIAVMQPYLFPYIGYFQLIAAVDGFVIYDDVNYIQKGWINRNNVLLDGKAHLFTLKLSKASQNRKINEILISGHDENKENLLTLFRHCYSKAPQFKKVFPLIEETVTNHEDNLSVYLESSIRKVCEFLRIDTKFYKSSEIKKDNTLKGESKIIDICKALGVNEYINLIGGVEIYSKDKFANNGLKIFFLKTEDVRYDQFDNVFVPSLSIVDILMFNTMENIREFLKRYVLV